MVMLLTNLELELLAFATRGEGVMLSGLRRQVGHLEASSRRLSGTGFFTDLSLMDGSLGVDSADFEISDIEGTAANLKHGFGCIIFVKNGQLDMIEAFTYAEDWPEDISDVNLSYSNPHQRNFDEFLR